MRRGTTRETTKRGVGTKENGDKGWVGRGGASVVAKHRKSKNGKVRQIIRKQGVRLVPHCARPPCFSCMIVVMYRQLVSPVRRYS